MTGFLSRHSWWIAGAAPVIVGLILQALLGPLDWKASGLWAVTVFAVIVIVLFLLRGSWLTRRLGSIKSATGSIAWTVAVTLVRGLVRQDAAFMGYVMPSAFPGFRDMLSNWSFILVYAWLLLSLLSAVVRVCFPFTLKRMPFFLYHAGLFWALLWGTVSSIGTDSYRMTLARGGMSNLAINSHGHPEELPMEIEMKDFHVTFYTGADAGTADGPIPEQYVSTIRIVEPDSTSSEFLIRVNHPARLGRWHIYQYGYDTDSSTLLIVSDRWRTMVGLGLLMMLAGAVCLFVRTSRKKEHQ